MTATESLQNLVEHCEGIPSADTTVDRLAEIVIDPAEFQKSSALRKTFAELLDYLKPIVSDEGRMTRIARLPRALQAKIQQISESVDKILQEMYSVLKPPPGPSGGVVPPRWDSRKFDSQATTVAGRHAELYQLLEPTREVSAPDVQEQLEKLNEAFAAAIRERESTKDTTEQLEKAKEESAAYVLSDVAITELDSAITAHSNSAKRWLAVVLIGALSAFRIAWWVNVPDDKILWWWGPIFPQPAHPLNSLEVAVNFGRKILILSAAFALPLLALHVYYTNVHNLIINRQRKISINAFTKFYVLMESADATTRIELVKQATQTIFGQGNTGFLAKNRNDFAVSQLLTTLLKPGKLH